MDEGSVSLGLVVCCAEKEVRDDRWGGELRDSEIAASGFPPSRE